MATCISICAGTQEVLLDGCGSQVEDIFDARARAYQVIQSIIRTAGLEDRRDLECACQRQRWGSCSGH